MSNRIKYIISSIILLCTTTVIHSQQITNQDVVAKINTKTVDDIITIQATGINKTPIYQSLRYEMIVIKTNSTSGNSSNGKQSGRFTLSPNETKGLSISNINKNSKDKITVVLLIYNDDELLGKDRLVVLNDDKKPNPNDQKLAIINALEKNNDGVEIIGIITEDLKTKPARDFFVDFSSRYRLEEKTIKKYNVHIVEKLSLGRNTSIDVLVNNTLIHRFLIQPNNDFISQMVQTTLFNIRRYYQQQEDQKNFINQY